MAVIISIFTLLILGIVNGNDSRDYEFTEPHELLIAQESRHYETIVKPPVTFYKPTGVTNSHRPQYNLDSLEFDLSDDLHLEASTKRNVFKNYKETQRSKEGMIKDAVLRALERKDHVGKFAQILPIITAMSENQRVALASLVASQVTTPPGRQPLNLYQVRSMFDNNNTATDLMLPILLDTANLIRRSLRSGKEPREVRYPQIQRRSFTEDTLDDEPFDTGDKENKTALQLIQRNRNFKSRSRPTAKIINTKSNDNTTQNLNTTNIKQHNTSGNSPELTESNVIIDDADNTTKLEGQYSKLSTTVLKTKSDISRSDSNDTYDLAAEASNTTLAQDLPVAEKLSSLHRYYDKKGNVLRRGTYPLKSIPRRTTPEPVQPTSNLIKRRPMPARKLPTSSEQAKCELFTNTLCLHTDDYPTEEIVQSIRRNKAAAGALLADYKDPGDGALDGITAAQEAKYTADHYLVSNRRGDTANRDFAGAGEAGFMCPSTVKYARPQRARATSGQWKYIVNTGEHTQTLRLEKCLKPKESCTYLTDNFKSKCVQVYNYHRLLTWDQQNGLHMDIFKVPTCCSCHIEGYSVSFPPVGHRIHETSSEQFPNEDLSSDTGNQAFESMQSFVQKPSLAKTPFSFNKPLESFPSFTNNHNLPGSFSKIKLSENEELNSLPSLSPLDSYGNRYISDSFNQASSIKNVKRPFPRSPVGFASLDTITLPSYLEPPTPATSSPFLFSKDNSNKFNINDQFKRGAIRPSRRPIRKTISSGPDDLISSGTSAINSYVEEFDDDSSEPEVSNVSSRVTIAPKLHVSSTEVNQSTLGPLNQNKVHSDGKKVNYNYHPIIDFFEGSENESIDREDSVPDFLTSPESEWKPINHPSSKTSNTIGRKKHK